MLMHAVGLSYVFQDHSNKGDHLASCALDLTSKNAHTLNSCKGNADMSLSHQADTPFFKVFVGN